MSDKGHTVRNVVLGCAVVLLLAFVAGGFAVYHFVWKPGKAMVAGGVEVVQKVEELARIEEEGVEDRSPYAPPADRRLTAGQVERFVAVGRQVRGALGPRFADLERRVEGFEAAGREPSLGELIDLWRQLGDLALEAKREQVAALNAQGFSLGEYEWVREQVYLGLGFEQEVAGLDELAGALRERGLDGLEELSRHERRLGEAAPPETRALVEPYRGELEEWLPLALLGM